MQLFIIYVGGRHERSFIELHDINFVIADTLEGAFAVLQKNWWGVPESLHIDCWGILKSADGHHIHLKSEPATLENRLYFINLGGYEGMHFTELHKNIFLVARNEDEAKEKALSHILDWQSPHIDYFYDVEAVVNFQSIAAAHHLHIHLEPTDSPLPFAFTCEYKAIGKKAVSSFIARTEGLSRSA